MRPLTRMALALLAGLLLIALILALALRGSPAPRHSATAPAPGASQFEGAALPSGISAPSFSLRDQAGRRVALVGHDGRVTVLAFLYSRCAACTLIAQQIRGALDTLARTPRVAIVSADPAADTPARVRRFLAQVSLTGRAEYLTGAAAELRRVWRAYRVTPAVAGPTAFAQRASVLLIDARGRERVVFGPEQLTPEALAHDVGRLQDG
jgi:cytochrome oxidase Cu insertion factor (SCO1/SenC/PrrC family)